MHVTLVPYIRAAGELKTKPTQQSIAKLREIGLQPQVLICRTEHPLDDDVRQKLSIFCNVPLERGRSRRATSRTRFTRCRSCCTQERLDEPSASLLRIDAPPPDMADWRKFV